MLTRLRVHRAQGTLEYILLLTALIIALIIGANFIQQKLAGTGSGIVQPGQPVEPDESTLYGKMGKIIGDATDDINYVPPYNGE